MAKKEEKSLGYCIKDYKGEDYYIVMEKYLPLKYNPFGFVHLREVMRFEEKEDAERCRDMLNKGVKL